MKDRELLEMAAKAAGYEVNVAKGGGSWINDGSKIWPKWNPITDDGDALRLAVKLDLSIFRPGSHPAALVSTDDAQTYYSDDCVRRAIVLGAAAIGRTKP
jgi:hypothetical protein